MTAVVERVEGLVRLEVDGTPCLAYPRLTGDVQDGDDVVVNEQARALGLGSGGFDVLVANLTRGLGLPAPEGAHVMELPYTPVQAAVRHGEEDGLLATSLEGMPVVCCTLHSQLAPVCAGLAGRRVVYVQAPGGALPVSLSDAVRTLRARGWGAEAVVAGIGPGIVGTGTRLGHGAVAAAEAANAAAALGGAPLLAVRVSEGDPRPRHGGVSHHVRAVLELALAPVRLPWPVGFDPPEWLGEVEQVDASAWREACAGLPLDHMGRGPDEDPVFFAAAYAAGVAAAALLPEGA